MRNYFSKLRRVFRSTNLNILGKFVYFFYFLFGKKGIALFLIVTIVASNIISSLQNVHAATYTWGQTSWAGGLDGGTYPNHTSNQSGWTKYSAKDSSISVINGGADLQLSTSISTTTQSDDGTTITGFNLTGKALSQTVVTGTGASASIGLTSSYNTVNAWTSLTAIPTAANMGSSLFNVNGYLYLAVGNNSTAFYRFASSTNTWLAMNSAPGTIQPESAAVHYGSEDKIYYGSGNKFYSYSVSTGLWATLVSAANFQRSGGLIRSTPDDYIYWLTGNGSRSLWRYSIGANSWTQLADAPAALYNGGTRSGSDNYIYVSQGALNGGFYRYNITTGVWDTRNNETAGEGEILVRNALNDEIYSLPANNNIFKKYIVSTNTWTPLTVLPVNITVTTDAHIIGDQMIRNGADNDIYVLVGNYSQAFYKYSISGNSWTAMNSAPSGINPGSSISRNGSDNDIYVGHGGNTTAFSKFVLNALVYSASGTFTSGVMDIGLNTAGWGNLSWTQSNGQTITIKVRSANNISMTGATAFASCTNITNGAALSTGGCITTGHRYVQYQATLSTSNTSLTPLLDSVSIGYATYPASSTLTSSAYNSSSLANLVSGISWSEATSSATDVRFQLRTAPASSTSPGAWSSFMGPDGTSATYFTNPSGAEATPAALRDATNDQWVQYKAFLISDGSATPTLSDTTVTYVVNAAPEFDPNYPTTAAGGVGAVQNFDGTLTINYSIKDVDTNTGSRNPGYVSPSFYYSLDNGSTFTLISTSTTMQPSSSSNKAVSTSTYTIYTATSTIINQLSSQYSATTKIKVLVNDNEAANNIASSTSAVFTLDTKTPTLGAIPILVDASRSPMSITLSATDDSTFQMKVGKTSDLSDVSNYYAYSNSTTSTTILPGDTVYAVFSDVKGNTTAISSTTPPTAVSNIFFQDTSNPDTSEWREFYAWGVSSVPPLGFKRYNIYRSVDGGNYILLTTVTNRLLNYIVDTALSSNSTYAYKVSVEDNNGNISFFSPASAADKPDGTGGSDLALPTLSSVSMNTITTTGASISWSSNKLSNSRVYYVEASTFPGTDKSSYTYSIGVPSMVTSHTVILSGLIPGSKYFFLVESDDSVGNSGQLSADSYTFTTNPGPSISNVTTAEVFDTEATIVWNTNILADSSVW